MNTQQSHINKQRSVYKTNREFVKTTISISDYDYNNMILETGLKFLENMYLNENGFEDYYEKFKSNSDYWVWWKSEFKQREHMIIRNYQRRTFKVSYIQWYSIMEQLSIDHEIMASYYNNFLQNNEFNK